MEIFFTANFEENQYTLSPEESNHCINVLRHKTNDAVTVTDGNGKLFTGTISEAHHKRCRIDISEVSSRPDINPYLHIAIAPTKNIERLEWFLEKATEIGINEITPLLCQHSERKQIRLDRLEKITISAMKQSGKLYLPKLNDLTTFKQFMAAKQNGLTCIAHCDEPIRTPLKNMVANQNAITILIGPEGDFSRQEIEIAIKAGYQCISLGYSRLRTETAGIVACHTVRVMVND